jgi:hypothetical protein
MLARLRAARLEGLLLLAAAASAGGCGKGLAGGSRDTAAEPAGQPAAATKPSVPAAGAAVSFKATTVKAGSLPGAPGRDPTREADLVAVELTAFEIDRAPFPNEDGKPVAELDYASASAACMAAGKRLCSELEWEHACANASAAANFERGAREWTLSAGQDALADARGGGEPARCGARSRVERSAKLGFRCCRGAEQAGSYPSPQATGNEALGAKPLALTVEQMRKALAGIESLAALAPSFQPFSTSDADAALRKGKRSRDGITAWSFLPSSIAWTPASGDELVVIAGRSGEQALIAVLYPLGDGAYAHAASAVLREPDVTVAIATNVATPTPLELLWTSCYGCPNEGGAIRYGDDRRVVIEFR